MITLFFALLVGHAVMDFWAQSDTLAKMKNRHRDPAQFCPPGQTPQIVWPYALSAHAGMHGGAVWLITGVWWLGLAEFVCHWVIDFGKCDGWHGMHVDQAAHIACKVAWVLISTYIVGWCWCCCGWIP